MLYVPDLALEARIRPFPRPRDRPRFYPRPTSNSAGTQRRLRTSSSWTTTRRSVLRTTKSCGRAAMRSRPAGSRADALAQIDRLDGMVDVLLIDITLPDADGAELAREIIERIGLRPALYVSGWSEEFWNLSDAPGRWLVMQKPIPIPRLDRRRRVAGGEARSPPG